MRQTETEGWTIKTESTEINKKNRDKEYMAVMCERCVCVCVSRPAQNGCIYLLHCLHNQSEMTHLFLRGEASNLSPFEFGPTISLYVLIVLCNSLCSLRFHGYSLRGNQHLLRSFPTMPNTSYSIISNNHWTKGN